MPKNQARLCPNQTTIPKRSPLLSGNDLSVGARFGESRTLEKRVQVRAARCNFYIVTFGWRSEGPDAGPSNDHRWDPKSAGLLRPLSGLNLLRSHGIPIEVRGRCLYPRKPDAEAKGPWRATVIGGIPIAPGMKVLLIYPEWPNTYWSFKYALPFVGKRSA